MGSYLDLHGAALTETFPDAEGELLRRIRAIIGPDMPLTISLDPHANLTRAMVELADAAVPFRTYPHVDMKAAGAQAVRLLLQRISRGAPWARAFRQAEFWIPLGSQCTLMEPMASLMAERAAAAERDGLVELAWCFGFPYADFPDCGPALAAFAETQAAADQAADAFLRQVAGRESSFVQETLAAAEAVEEARRLVGTGIRPVVLADTQDNPGGGGHGDTTGLLAELVRQGAAGALVCLINDADSAAACHAAGESATLALSLGGKSDGMGLRLHRAGVEADRRTLHPDRPDGRRQSGQSGSQRADRDRRGVRDRGQPEDAGAGSGDHPPFWHRSGGLPDHRTEIIRAFPRRFCAHCGRNHRGDCAGAGRRRPCHAELPARPRQRTPPAEPLIGSCLLVRSPERRKCRSSPLPPGWWRHSPYG